MLKAHNARYIMSVVRNADYPVYDAAEVVLLGRSNVGKSTFINKFCGRKNLAYTSSRPGKTQTLNFYYLNDGLSFVDVPGYGYARVSKSIRSGFGEMIEEYLVTRHNLKFAVLLIDFKVGPTSDDILMYEFLRYNNCRVLVIATKKDKVKKTARLKQKAMIMEKMKFDKNSDFMVYSSEDRNDMFNIYTKFEEILGATDDQVK